MGNQEEQEKIQQLIEVVGVCPSKALRYLEATNWSVAAAIDLFFARDGDDVSDEESNGAWSGRAANDTHNEGNGDGQDLIAAARPVIRDRLYSISHPRGRLLGEADDNNYIFGRLDEPPRDAVAAMLRPPVDIMFRGHFEGAKQEAVKQGKWLIVNVQDKGVFDSFALNRDTWNKPAVKEVIASNFIFWQVYNGVEEGRKLCSYYKLTTFPAILILDPITGIKMKALEGKIEAGRLLEVLSTYVDVSPLNYQFGKPKPVNDGAGASSSFASPAGNAEAGSTSLEEEDKNLNLRPAYPDLPEEPQSGVGVISVGIRFPDGRRVQRRFGSNDSIRLLWSFVAFKSQEAAAGRPFRLVSPPLGLGGRIFEHDVESTLTFAEAAVSNTLLSVAWDD